MIQLFGGELLRNIRKKEGARMRLVIPAKFRETVMELCHELPSAGHQGTEPQTNS
jgi:DNA-binding transcriptional regulator/RsmH inhibitor MraZ